jgi:hypothetical protein
MDAPPLPDALPMVQVPQTSVPTDGPLVPPITFPPPFPFPLNFRSVRQGAWLVSYVPSNTTNVAYDGTIRVESQGATRTASGDLYQRPVIIIPAMPFPFPRGPITLMLNPPDPAKGIPIQARNKYRYYLRVTQILEFLTFGNSFELGLQMWKYTAAPNNTATWTNDGDYTATMTWVAPPANSGYPSARDYLEGDLKKAGAVVGRLKMGWVSQSYRKATLEIDTVNGADRPLDSGAGQSWQTVYQNLGYDMTVDLSETNIPEPSGEGWSDAEAHAAMLAHRDENNLDIEWRYHILAVKKLDSTPRGKMYDWQATDSDKVPREGVAIAAGYVFESAPDPASGIPDWGAVKGKQFSTVKPAYFRAAVHELGHAFNISRHNTVNMGFMNTTDAIAQAATPATPFPSNILWDYADDDRNRLRHWSDMFVRPGGIVFGGAINTTLPITPNDDEIEVPELQLEVTALLSEVPLGAPVRIDVKLTNTSATPMLAPREVGLRSACMSGFVQDPSGRVRSFRPLIHCVDSIDTAILEPGKTLTGSMTLLRGSEGALFPSSGVCEITLKAGWDVGDGSANAMVVGKTTVFVTDAHNPHHAAAAHRILTTPDAHLVLVMGGDHLQEGVEAIQQAVRDETLGPHYRMVEARRLAKPFKGRCADCEGARGLMEGGEVVSSEAEKGKLERLFKRFGGDEGDGKQRNGAQGHGHGHGYGAKQKGSREAVKGDKKK